MSETVAAPSRLPSRRGLVLLWTLGIIGIVILCGLGTWQVQRLHWKEDLIARAQSRSVMPPIPAPGPAEWPDIDLAALDYASVTVTGTFRHADEARVYEALSEAKGPYSGSGYFILTPLTTTDGWVVLVNRGFVPEELKDAASRPLGQVEGVVTITGLLRPPQGRNPFTPGDDPADNLFFTRDPATIGAARGIPLETLAPYLIDANFDPTIPGGIPQGGETLLSFPNNHLQYVVTWYGLAVVLLAMLIAFTRSRWKKAG